ncbi:unnamed protein product [Phaedon cochleariae]|uniref:Menorin-like domain-containing protein n=1 Tax=Phaedon cochleariae TaxID=80249 RepID=A0A9P0DTH4_PHACE|nr:unnamed protein product [Phaedon cochleariae]
MKNSSFFTIGCLILHRMCLADINTFFPQIKGDLTLVTWAHAVNNASYLNSILNNDAIMMIEADIVLGTLNGSTEIIPIMGHPPNNTSDLSLAQFMERISDFNAKSNSTSSRKGVKLDFKTIEAFNNSVATITASNSTGKYPLWINADILRGPTNATADPVNADQFLSISQQFNNTVLSIGWTTRFTNISTGYSDTNIEDMNNTITKNNVTNEITFPVRAALAANSLPQMKKLLNAVNGSTLTIWSSDENDKVDVASLKTLIADVGHTKVYLDVPEHLRKQILSNSGNRMAMSAFITIVIAGLVSMFY